MYMKTVLFLFGFYFNYVFGDEPLSINELKYELKLLQTELLLFTEQSTITDNLIVKDILELERSIIKIQTMLNITTKANRGLKDEIGANSDVNRQDIMKRISALEKSMQTYEKENKKKDELIEKLGEQMHNLQDKLRQEQVQRLGLEKDINKLKSLASKEL